MNSQLVYAWILHNLERQGLLKLDESRQVFEMLRENEKQSLQEAA